MPEPGNGEDDRLFTKWQRDYERRQASLVMSAEQGNVQPWRENIEQVREALKLATWEPTWLFPEQEKAEAALDALTTQIEELETQLRQERHRAINAETLLIRERRGERTQA